jgi:hypothetical protein
MPQHSANPQVHKSLKKMNFLYKETVQEAGLNPQEQKMLRFTKIF